jgi:hypothetical protein
MRCPPVVDDRVDIFSAQIRHTIMQADKYLTSSIDNVPFEMRFGKCHATQHGIASPVPSQIHCCRFNP